jgi:hypothetical protein
MEPTQERALQAQQAREAVARHAYVANRHTQ